MYIYIYTYAIKKQMICLICLIALFVFCRVKNITICEEQCYLFQPYYSPGHTGFVEVFV